MNRFRSLIAMGGAAALLAAGPAFAHAKLTNSDPAANASLKASPKAITLTFSEELVPAFSKVELAMAMAGQQMSMPVKVKVLPDGKHMVATPASPLTHGDYKVVWSAATADGHKMTGEVPFKVN